MKKTTKNLLILLAVLVVVGGGAAALLLTRPATEEESSALSSTVTETVVDRKTAEVSSIQVKNALSEYEIIPVEQPETAVTSSASLSSDAAEPEPTFNVKGLQTYPVETQTVDSVAAGLVSITAAKNLGTQENLENFSLSGDGESKVTVRYKDGTEDTLIFGTAGTETSGRYLLKDGTVYIIAVVSVQLFESEMTYLKKELYTVVDRIEETVDSAGSATEGVGQDVLDSMVLSGTGYAAPIEVKYDATLTNGYRMVTPMVTEVGSNRFDEIIATLKTLSADSVVAVGTDKAADYGLSEPYAQVAFTMNGESHTLKVSAPDDEKNCYLLVDDTDLLYQVAFSKVSPWAQATVMDLRTGFVWLPNIMEVNSLTLTAGGNVNQYDITRAVNDEKSTESNTSYELTIRKDGKQLIDYENYQSFYKKLISLAVLSSDVVTYGETPVFTVEYGYFNGNPSDKIEFFPVEGQDRYAALLNGVYSGLVRKTEVDDLVSQIDKLNNNEEVS